MSDLTINYDLQNDQFEIFDNTRFWEISEIAKYQLRDYEEVIQILVDKGGSIVCYLPEVTYQKRYVTQKYGREHETRRSCNYFLGTITTYLADDETVTISSIDSYEIVYLVVKTNDGYSKSKYVSIPGYLFSGTANAYVENELERIESDIDVYVELFVPGIEEDIVAFQFGE